MCISDLTNWWTLGEVHFLFFFSMLYFSECYGLLETSPLWFLTSYLYLSQVSDHAPNQVLAPPSGTASLRPILYPLLNMWQQKSINARGNSRKVFFIYLFLDSLSGYNQGLLNKHNAAVHKQTLEWDDICVCTPPALELSGVPNDDEDKWRCLY